MVASADLIPRPRLRRLEPVVRSDPFEDGGTPLANLLVNRLVLPGEVAVVAGEAYLVRRRLALMAALQVVLRGTPVLIASPLSGLEVIDDLVSVSGWRIAWGDQPAGPGTVRRSIGESPPRIAAGPHVTLSHLWSCAADQMSRPGRRIFGLVVVDAFDAFESYREDLGRVGETARFMGAPLLVLNLADDRSWEPAAVAQLVIVPEDEERSGAGCRPLAWVGRPTPDDKGRFNLYPVGADGALIDIVGEAVRRLGVPLDPLFPRPQRDHDGAIFGWRVLDVGASEGAAILRSPMMETEWPRPVQEARCPHHHPPEPGCHCGIYALFSVRAAWSGLWHRTNRTSVVALVRGFGRVAMHSEGWRAQYVQPIALFGRVSDLTRRDLERRYECDVILTDISRTRRQRPTCT